MFEKCSCNHCSGHIEFDASEAGQVVACPHCGLETKLYVPQKPSNKPPQNISIEIKRGANPLGVASLVLGIGACVFCWIPFLGLLAIPLAAIGLLLAVIGITSAAVGKKSSPAFPIGGAAVCIVAILVALFVTGWISTLIAKHEVQSNSTYQKIPTESAPVSSGTTANLPTAATPQSKSPSSEKTWSKSFVVQQGDFQIQIEPISKEIFYPNNPSRIATPNDGFFTIKLSNLSKTRKIDFSTWRGKKFSAGRDYATLTDDNGNVYKLDSENNRGRQDETSVYPNSHYEEFLSFETPVQNRKWLHLELPAENFGGSGMIRFEIPSSKFLSQSAGMKADINPKSFKQGEVEIKINDVVRSFTKGESPAERGQIVKTSDFLLVRFSLENKSSDRIYDYKTFRSGVHLTDDRGNDFSQSSGRSSSEIDPYGQTVYLWEPPYPLNDKIYPCSARIRPNTGQDDVVAFDVPNSTGTNLFLELPAANIGGTGIIKFEIPVSIIKDW